jgi:hypothetical protein
MFEHIRHFPDRTFEIISSQFYADQLPNLSILIVGETAGPKTPDCGQRSRFRLCSTFVCFINNSLHKAFRIIEQECDLNLTSRQKPVELRCL